MKKVIFAALLFIVMFALELNGKEHIQTIESLPLTRAESLVLEENVNVILSDIIDCDINYDASKVVLTSGMKQVIVIYNYKNGKILQYKRAGLYLSDSIKHTNRVPPANPYNQIPMYPIKYLSLEECKEVGFNDLRMLKNVFMKVIFNEDDCISSLALIYLPTLMKDNEKTALNTAAIVKFDSILNIRKIIFPNNTLENYTIPFCFISDNDNYYLLNETPGPYIYYKRKDSLPVLSIYNKNGEYVKTALYLDNKFANDEFIFLSFMHPPITTTINNKNFSMLPLVPNVIYNLTTDDTISLSNPIVDYSEKYEEARNEIKKLDKNESSAKIIDKYMPLSAFKLMNNGKNLIICYMKEEEDNASFIFREYDTNGKFISERTFENKEKLNVQNLLYDKKNNYIVFFIKGEENWTMEKYRW